MSRILMLSNSTMPGTPFFTWPKPHVLEFLSSKTRNLVFIPFAAVTISFDAYEDVVQKAFEEFGYLIHSIHRVGDKIKMLQDADGIIIGGGNTFALLNRLYQEGLVSPIRKKIKAGTPYIGWSAGANVVCPTIMTTNDMPIVYPPSYEALNLVPFQINPHYHELKFPGQGGETRKERLEEFIQMNPSNKVIGLPEGMLLHKEYEVLTLKGEGMARLYQAGNPVRDLQSGTDLSYLLE